MDQSLPEPLASEVQAALLKGNKIEAIKIYREAAGCGLKEAKEAVERYAAQVEREQPGLLPKAAGCATAILLFGAFALSAGFAWMAI